MRSHYDALARCTSNLNSRTELVEGSNMSTFEHGPEGLNTIGMSLAPDVFPNRVLDGFMVGKDVIDQGVIGVDFGIGVGVFHDELDDGLRLGVRNNPCLNLVGGSVFDARHGDFANWTSASQFGLLGLAHVPSLAAEIALINFHRTSKRSSIAAATVVPVPSFSDSVEHEPCGRLADSDITSQLRRGNAFQASQFQVDRQRPLPQWKIGLGNRGSSPDGEVFSAIPAPVRHGFAIRGFMSVVRTAPAAVSIL